MRTVSIVSIIRKYGLSSKRLNPKNRIRYEDAIKGLKGYESSELKIVEVIDNHLFPNKSISCNCQIPGCNHKIRYEYVLENKCSKDKIVAGSTCVWPTLGFSEIEKKDFLRYEKVVKKFHDMVEWKDKNLDVWDKLMKLKSADMSNYRAFWKEVEYCRLTDEDTEYIRGLDVDELIRRRDRREQEKEEFRRMSTEQKKQKEVEYNKVLDGLETLLKRYPDNRFYQSLDGVVRAGYKLSNRQLRCIKVGCNKMWYEDNIKGTSRDIMDKCEEILSPILERYSYKGNFDEEAVKIINANIVNESGEIKLAWNLFKVKEGLVL